MSTDTPTPAEVASAVAANTLQPQTVQTAGLTVTQHSLPDQIAAAKFAAGTEAVKSAPFGLRFATIVPPSATGG